MHVTISILLLCAAASIHGLYSATINASLFFDVEAWHQPRYCYCQ